MKKRETENEADDLLAEYDFSGKKGVRGRYYRAYRQGHAVRIHKANGTVKIKYFTLEDGAVMLEPDVRKHFRDSRSVNRALRILLSGRASKEKPSSRAR